MRLRWLVGLVGALLLTLPAWVQWTDPHLNLLWEDAKGVDDAKHHMLRLFLLEWLVRRGVWYPRWVPDLYMGFGYPIFSFYAPGYYYLTLLTRTVLRLDVWDAYRSGGVVAALLLAGGTYTLAASLWRRPATGIVASIAVCYGPYVLQTNLFQRGDVPEAMGLALLPWLLWAIWRLWQSAPGQRGRWIAAPAAAGAAMLLVHNLSALVGGLVAVVWVAYLLAAQPGRWRLAAVALAGALALGWSAFFWVPAVAETRAVQLELLQEGHLDYRQWLLDPSGQSSKQQAPENRQTRAGLIDLHVRYPHQHQFIVTLKPSLAQAGLAGLAALGLLAGLRRRGRVSETTAGALLPFLAVSIACWLLLFDFAAPVWQAVPLLPLFQEPGRLLGPLGICVAMAGAGGLAVVSDTVAPSRRWQGPLGWGLAALVGAAVLFNGAGDREVPLFDHPKQPMDGRMVVKEESDRVGSSGTTTGGEYTPRDVRIAVYTEGQRRGRPVFEKLYPEHDWLGGLLYPMAGDLRFLGWHGEPLRLSVRVANDAPPPGGGPAQVGLRQFRFPGWRAWVDGRPVVVGVAPWIEAQQASLGFIVVDVPPGEHTVTLGFGPSAARLAGLLATAATAAGSALLLVWAGRRLPLPLQGRRAMLLAAGVLLVAALVWRGVRPAFHRFDALDVPFPAPVDGVWQVSGPDKGYGSRLLVNVAEAVRGGFAEVSSPAGAVVGPEKFVDVRQLTLTDADRERGTAGTSRREWLYMHPPASVALDLRLPAGRQVWFQAALALDPQVWEADEGDGVQFQALVAPRGAPGRHGAGLVAQPARERGRPALGAGGGRSLRLGRADGAPDATHTAQRQRGL